MMDMTKILEYLETQDYNPTVIEHGNIVFKSNGIKYLIDHHPDDEHYLSIDMPYIWGTDNKEVKIAATLIANAVTFKIKAAKVYVFEIDNKVVATSAIEMYVDTAESFIAVFPQCLKTIKRATKDFCENIYELMREHRTDQTVH